MPFTEVKIDRSFVMADIPAAAKRVQGIDRGTVRTSASPSAFSFALDPAAQSPESAVAELQKRLRTQGVRLSVLRVMGGEAKAARN
jgi:chloramphenicol 3-O-phosphotransferase